ncbi:hypothetical protein Q763_00965 [Flavobacterium beibuense F44-8]|uniref:Uncharacterized protein n=1 Tax=Flavobacterium beibuense F44-8 TaxID=1406840 RepID=A0A0A2LYQ7_9FLAO|nr:hypothetical protein [Flavobacterium beibuense]KGO84348.1 hypothetical protein Q763_00965 [Flavobacterium beibuense F44-8]
MKFVKAKIDIFFILITLLLFSCQSEENIVLQDTSGNLISESELVVKMMKIAQNPVSADNIIDSTDCFSVKLPVVVTANGEEITIANETDFTLVEDVFNQSQQDVDEVQVQLPVTVVYADYTDEVINTHQEWLQAATCNENGSDLTCIAFEYPLSVNTYDTVNQIADVVVVDDNMELYGFLNNLSDSVLAAIAYPVVVLSPDGDEISATDNEGLLNAINQFANLCE